jgi:hypothetical protein
MLGDPDNCAKNRCRSQRASGCLVAQRRVLTILLIFWFMYAELRRLSTVVEVLVFIVSRFRVSRSRSYSHNQGDESPCRSHGSVIISRLAMAPRKSHGSFFCLPSCASGS